MQKKREKEERKEREREREREREERCQKQSILFSFFFFASFLPACPAPRCSGRKSLTYIFVIDVVWASKAFQMNGRMKQVSNKRETVDTTSREKPLIRDLRPSRSIFLGRGWCFGFQWLAQVLKILDLIPAAALLIK